MLSKELKVFVHRLNKLSFDFIHKAGHNYETSYPNYKHFFLAYNNSIGIEETYQLEEFPIFKNASMLRFQYLFYHNIYLPKHRMPHTVNIYFAETFLLQFRLATTM